MFFGLFRCRSFVGTWKTCIFVSGRCSLRAEIISLIVKSLVDKAGRSHGTPEVPLRRNGIFGWFDDVALTCGSSPDDRLSWVMPQNRRCKKDIPLTAERMMVFRCPTLTEQYCLLVICDSPHFPSHCLIDC